MKQSIHADNLYDDTGSPAGGYAISTGLRVNWQNGPLGRGDERKAPNGAFVETVIEVALQRLEFYQTSKFKCVENENAIKALQEALFWLGIRTANRENRGVEGTHET